jgi:Autotransporter beta-domain
MEMKIRNAVLVAALAAATGYAQAGGIGVRAGTTGVGVDLGGDVMPTLGWRLGLSGMNVNTDVDTSQVTYDAKVKVLTGSLLLDWSPLGPFRISGGFMPNNNKIDLTGRPSGGSFPPGSSLTGEVKPERSFAPYLGVGYGNVWTRGVNFYFDLGVMFQGTPEVSLTLSCAPSPSCTAAQGQVEAERQRVQDKVDKYKYYPVANIGLTIGW